MSSPKRKATGSPGSRSGSGPASGPASGPGSGTPPPRRTVHLVSLGCAKNRVDSEVLLGRLRKAGYEAVAEPEEASLLVVNTCGFIEAAREESVDAVLEAARWKAGAPDRRILVAGCLVQRYGEGLAAELPEVDKFLGTAQLGEVVEWLGQPGRVRAESGRSFLYDHREERQPSLGPHTAYVKIAEGCDRPCAFCAVPGIRGPQQSRAPESVRLEVEGLVASGVREVCLVAQDLTAYGRDRGAPGALAPLVASLGEVPGLAWLRLLYAYPSEVDEALLAELARPPVVPYLDVPFQHLDDGVLRRMRRGYTGAQVERLVERLRAAVPGIHLRTSLLVGHPGETAAAFRRLARFVAEAQLDHVGVFAFSPEEGTPSAGQPDPVAPEEAVERAGELMEVQRAVSGRKLAAFVGRRLTLLLEGESPESELLWAARHAGQAPEVDGMVHVADVPEGTRVGALVEGEVEQAGDYDLVARFVGPSASARG